MKTLIDSSSSSFDCTVVWIEGANIELSFERISGFGMVGGVINTNSGIRLTKEMLTEIVEKMPDKSELRVCGTNTFFSKEDINKEFGVK